MASARLLAWIDALAWTAIYGGIIALILGIATGGRHLVAGWSLGVLGGIAVVAGIVLIAVRSRLRDPSAMPGGAKSTQERDTTGRP